MRKKINHRKLLAAAHDVAASALAWIAAFQLRFNFEIPPEYLSLMFESLPWVVASQTAVLCSFGLYRQIWRFTSLADLRRILLTVSVATGALVIALFMMRIPVPRSALVLDPMLLIFMMAGSRLVYRMRKERRVSALLPVDRQRVLVLGAGNAGAKLVSELRLSPDLQVVGLLDDDRLKHGRLIHGVRILGRLDQLPELSESLCVDKAIIALPGTSHQIRRRAVELCRVAGVRTLTVPSYDDLISGKVTASQIRSVELDDLLGRDPVQLDTGALSEWISGRTVLVTGAGGSIGAELCRQLLRQRPRALILLELGEHALYQVEQEISSNAQGTELIFVIGDVKNRRRLNELIGRYRPSIVFHAAAYKHVPLMESENAWEALHNNVTGTRILAETAIRHGVEKFVLISTDKAVNPTNVMGASKRLAELVCQAMQQPGGTQFVIVRFGNVLGSSGSVVPKFRAQIAAGGPVTVTHPEIRRYFMSIAEAAQLVLQAGLIGSGGQVLVLDMGEAVKIADLARDLIRLSGFDEEDIRIEYTGLRPGEKLYEELLANDENTLPTSHPKLRIATIRGEDRAWLERLMLWLDRVPFPTGVDVRRELRAWVPEYVPQDIDENPSRDRKGAGV